MEQISIVIIDPTDSSDLKERLEKKHYYKVLGYFNNIDIGFTQAERYQPSLILLNVDLLGLDIPVIAETFAIEFPLSSLVLVTTSKSRRILRYALQSGAKDVICLPIDDQQLYRSIDRVVGQESKRRQTYTIHKKEAPKFKTITVFGTKGGVGKSTVALNLAVTLRKLTKKRVALIDLDLMSGNIALMSGVTWKRSIKDVLDEVNNLDEETLNSYLITHHTGIKILAAPIHPEYMGFIQPEHIETLLTHLSHSFNYVIIDAPSHFHDTLIPALEISQDILLVTTLDLPAIQNLKQCLELLGGLSMQKKVRVVVNRFGHSTGLKINDLENELGMAVQCSLPELEKVAVHAANIGEPLVISVKNSAIARVFMELAAKLMSEDDSVVPKSPRASKWLRISKR